MQKLTKICVVIIALSPLTFLLTGQEWLYTPLRYLDGYFDIGYSFFFDNGNYHLYTYKSARTPWHLIIFYLQKLTGPQYFSPVLTVTFLVAVITLYYNLIKAVFNARSALVILPWLAFFPHLFGVIAGGIIYNNTGAVCYFLAALLFWSKRLCGGRFLLSVLAGFFVASSIFTNLVYLNLLLLFPAVDLQMKTAFRSKDYGAAVLGMALSVPFWGLVNVLHNRKFLFFENMLYVIKKFILNPSNQSQWWNGVDALSSLPAVESVHLVFIVAFFVTAIVQLATKKSFSKALTGHYAGLFLLWCLWHYTGQTALHPSDFSYALQIPCFLMIASWIPQRDLSKKDLLFAALTAAFLWICLYFSYPLKAIFRFEDGTSNIYLCALAILALLLLFASPKIKYPVISFLLLGFVFSETNFEPRSQAGFDCTVRRESHAGLMHIASTLVEIDPAPTRFMFFVGPTKNVQLPPQTCLYDNKIQLQELSTDLACMLGYGFGEYDFTEARSRDMAFLTKEDVANFQGYMVLLPYESKNFSSDFLKKVRSLGLNLQKTHSFVENIMGQSVPYEVYRRLEVAK